MEKEGLKKFIGEVRTELDKRMLHLPYQFNIIDETLDYDKNSNLKETAHSRVLSKILQYRNTEGKYVFLDNFLKIIINNKGMAKWETINVNNPNFGLEVPCPSDEDKDGRIDLLIEDKDYAIIIENKANDATIQEHQLGRYIEKVKEFYNEQNIYVVFLPTIENEKLIDSAWLVGNVDKGYKEKFKDRFCILSFKENILPWLIKDNEIIPTNNRNSLFKLSLGIYIDYLNEIFENRDLYKDLISNIINEKKQFKEKVEYCSFIESIIDLEKKLKEKRQKKLEEKKQKELKNNRKKINELKNEINDLRTEINDLRIIINIGLKEIYPIFTPEDKGVRDNNRELHLGCVLNFDEVEYWVYIGNNKVGLYCSLLSKINKPIKEEMQRIMKIVGLRHLWKNKDFLYDGYDRDYKILPKLELFFKVMDKCEELKKQEKKV